MERAGRRRITAAQYKAHILPYGFDGVKSAGNPIANVIAPAILNPSPSKLDSYLKNNGQWVRTGLAGVSYHAYADYNTQIALGDAIEAWCDPQVNCQSFWITEFGFSSSSYTCNVCGQTHSSDPSGDTAKIMNRCADISPWLFCYNASVFTLTDRWKGCNTPNADCTGASITCPMALLKFDGGLKKKFCDLEHSIQGTYTTPGCPVP